MIINQRNCPLLMSKIKRYRINKILKRIMSVKSLLRPRDTDLTVYAKVVVEVLEERETVPRVWRLEFQYGVHVDGEQRPEDLGVFDHQITVPRKRLYTPSNIAVNYYRIYNQR